ncbi:MAG: peptidylprolyl isomerase [Myxococcales bacterium]|nr:peptidylprolyl isomerase [Myxococcales bacterium]
MGAVASLEKHPLAEVLVLRGLADADPAVVAEAASAAEARKLVAAAPGLVGAEQRFSETTEYETLQAVLSAIGALKVVGGRGALERHAHHPNAAVRAKAQAALAAMSLPVPPPPADYEREVEVPTRPDAAQLATEAVVQTTKGPVRLTLFADDAPGTVANFVSLARKGYYDGLLFHRVVPDFVAQGGDPRGDGWGGPGYVIPCEINRHPYGVGAVGMALAGKDTGGSQFFFTHAPQPHLDGGYTVFAQVADGQGVVDALMVGDRILRIEVK